MISEKIDLGMGSAAVRGRAQVQVFDAETGACLRDETRDNFVSPRFLRALAQHANHAIFSTAGANNTGVNTLSGVTGYVTTPITGIVLTDYDGEPDPESERFVRGRPTGHASLRQAGNGAAMGSYNQVESLHEFDYHKYVFDFTTSEANGAFQSIYSGYFDSGATTDVYTAEKAAYRVGPTYFTQYNPSVTVLRDFATDNFYLIHTSKVAHRVAGQEIWRLAYGVMPTPAAVLELPFAPVNFRAAAIKDGRLYWLNEESTYVSRIYSAPLGDLESYRVEKTFDAAWAATRGAQQSSLPNSVRGFTFNPARNKFIIGNMSTVPTGGLGFAILELDPDTFEDGDAFGAIGNSMHQALVSFPDEKGIISLGPSRTRAIAQETTDDGDLYITHTFAEGPRSLITSDIAYSNVSSTAYGQSYALAPAQWFFSRALLDTPVTKTAQNTMKITYEFTFDPPNLG